MFGLKNKNPKSQVEVSIETMEGNLKGEGGRAIMVEYDKSDSTKDTKDGVTPPPVDNANTASTKEPIKNSPENKKAPFKSPFEGGDLPIGSAGAAGSNIAGQGTFPPAVGGLETGALKNDSGSIESPKKDDATFLHQAVDGKIDDKNKIPNNQIAEAPTKKKGGINSFLLIVLFIALLAGILFGGYYFYMNKSGSSPDPERIKEPVKTDQNSINKENTSTNEPEQEKEVQAVPKIEKLVTSTETFNDDLTKFILDLKQRRAPADLKNGIFISPMATTENSLLSSELLKALHATAFFVPADLKDSCKIFAIEDSGEVRLAVIFELVEVADEKLVKSKIIQNEKDLMKKMSYLFVDGARPIVPAKVSFVVNKENMSARYSNYVPSIDTSSVDWNILDLGKGKLVYFATSRKTAKVLTDYFMRTVIK